MLYRVCYADTDAGGVVYHAAYLAIFERARTEFFRERGVSVSRLHDEGTIFPVIRVEVDYQSPARLDDLLRVETSVTRVGKSSFTLSQRCLRADDATVLVKGVITLVAVSPAMKPRRIPPALIPILTGELTTP
ncbi:MAG: YbgC/FadM family acyl-CoA thioesterase [Desulfuromonadia bacterium]